MRSSDHITDALVCFQWLRIPERIEYKIALLTYKVMNGMAPRYLVPFVRVADMLGRRALRSAVTNHLTVPAVKLSMIGSRAFSVLWSSNVEPTTGRNHLCDISIYLPTSPQDIFI